MQFRTVAEHSLQLVTKQLQITVILRNNAVCGERLAVQKLSIIKLG
jgi:hypothetical protein